MNGLRLTSRDRLRRLRVSPRLVVLAALLVSFGSGLLFPLQLSRPPSGALGTVYVAGLVIFGCALALVLHSAVSPQRRRRINLTLLGGLVLVAIALWTPAYMWSRPGEEPWAWLAGFTIGACLLADARVGVLVALGLAGLAGIGAAAFEGSVAENLGYTLGSGAVLWLSGLVLVWLLRLVWAADAGREAEAELLLAQERLRVGQELHDVLGHRLGIIVLKAELAGHLAKTDPIRAAAETAEIRQIAAATLADARRAVQGESVTDLPTQLASAELVLGSAGIDTTVDVDLRRVPASASRLLAEVVREAVTNILRHSDARKVCITFDDTESRPTLFIVNDGAGRRRSGPAPVAGSTGTGLAALAARSAAGGARLFADSRSDESFEVRLELPPAGTSSTR
jgi:two-component system sensor histidine kinase DesK